MKTQWWKLHRDCRIIIKKKHWQEQNGFKNIIEVWEKVRVISKKTELTRTKIFEEAEVAKKENVFKGTKPMQWYQAASDINQIENIISHEEMNMRMENNKGKIFMKITASKLKSKQ